MDEPPLGWAPDSWTHERYCDAFEAEAARFVQLIDGADPQTPVPTCPGWSLASLTRHHGTTHRWVEYIVRHRASAPVSSRQISLELPDAEADYPKWVAAGADELLTTLRAVHADTPIWAWGADKRARFWSRRMLHEGLIHRADAEFALGRDPRIAPAAATDGIDEFLANLPFVPEVAERFSELGGNGETLHLHATDCTGEWLITLDPDGFSWARGHAKGAVAARGNASELLLLVYGRVKPADSAIQIFGDGPLLERWIERAAF